MKTSRKRPRSNVVQLVNFRNVNDDICNLLPEDLHVTDVLLERLGLEAELEGHDGCVNCLEWSESGRLLASGSDDTNVILWDPFRKKLLNTYQTLHQGNIFSIKFLPQNGDGKIVTGAADTQALGMDLETKETFYVCSCSNSRIKRLATAPDSPHVFWSASEDGIIRQTDLRVAHACDGKVDNVFINLRNHQGVLAEGKCLAINPLRPEMLAVGSNDPYVRLYDRRMISVTSDYESSQWYQRVLEENGMDKNCSDSDLSMPWKFTDNLVGGCVQYFVPGHLQIKNGFKRPKHTATTYVTFSPDGRYLLANLGSEQVYLFDVTTRHNVQSFSVPKNAVCANAMSEAANGCSSACYSGNIFNEFASGESSCKNDLPDYIKELKQKANEYFNVKDYQKAIRIYNEAIGRFGSNSLLYGNRAAAYMKRAWRGDMYAALKDCRLALKLDPTYMKAFFRLARCLHELKRIEEARECLNQFKLKYANQADHHACRSLEKDIDNAFKKMLNEKSKRSARNEPRTTRSVLVSLHIDGIYVADTNLELQVSNAEKLWRSNAADFQQRYCGHCNATTDIKEANFFGRNGRYIVAGSDDGSILFWDRYTENNLRILKGDSSIVNCLQPHPSCCFLATSGIDPVVRLWSPMPEEGWCNDRVVDDLDVTAEKNNKRMRKDFIDIMMQHFSYSSDDSNDNVEDHNYLCRPS